MREKRMREKIDGIDFPGHNKLAQSKWKCSLYVLFFCL